jgi:hypothetical protein
MSRFLDTDAASLVLQVGQTLFPLQRHGLGVDPVAEVWAQAPIAEHVHLTAKQILQVLPQPDKIQQASSRFHLDQQVYVASCPRLTLGDRAEDANIVRAGPAAQLTISSRRARSHQDRSWPTSRLPVPSRL